MSREKHEIVYYNNDYYVCVYNEEKEDKCCCLSFSKLFEKGANNKLFLVSLIDTEYLNAIISFFDSHPDMVIGILCNNNTLCIRLIEFKRIQPGKNKDEEGDEDIKNKIAHAIDKQLVGFFELIEEKIIKPYKVKKKVGIDKKFFLIVPKDSVTTVTRIVKETLRNTTSYNLFMNNQLKIIPCKALETSCSEN